MTIAANQYAKTVLLAIYEEIWEIQCRWSVHLIGKSWVDFHGQYCIRLQHIILKHLHKLTNKQ